VDTGCDIAGCYIQFPNTRASSGSDEGSPLAANPHAAASRGTDSAVWFWSGLVFARRRCCSSDDDNIACAVLCWSLRLLVVGIREARR
jgi:hypothetical protein